MDSLILVLVVCVMISTDHRVRISAEHEHGDSSEHCVNARVTTGSRWWGVLYAGHYHCYLCRSKEDDHPRVFAPRHGPGAQAQRRQLSAGDQPQPTRLSRRA